PDFLVFFCGSTDNFGAFDFNDSTGRSSRK
ncbi:hypothetical protein CCACVL1_04376, partial [Corchorus capsularis]